MYTLRESDQLEYPQLLFIGGLLPSELSSSPNKYITYTSGLKSDCWEQRGVAAILKSPLKGFEILVSSLNLP